MSTKRNSPLRNKPRKRVRGSASGGLTKTAFVLSFPLDVPAAEVVKAASEKGIELSAQRVHKIRSRHRVRARTAGERRARGRPTSHPSASAFIRSQPLTMSPAEVVTLARQQGLEISPRLVYAVRAAMRRKSLQEGVPAESRPRSRPGAARVSPAEDSTEREFRGLLLELGFGRARALLAEVEQGLQALIEGG